MKTISCIIPAYNEEKGIGPTLEAVAPLIGNVLHEVIVVNDASKDGTKDVVGRFPGVHLITHETNKGKSRTVADGINASTGDYIFLLDADLKFIESKNITDLIEPIGQEKAEVAISYIKNAWPLFPFKTIDYLSGQRIIAKEKLIPHIKDMAELPSYGLEVFLNKIIIQNKLRIAIVKWPHVENDFNQYKYGWVKGMKIVAGIWMNVISTVGIIGMYTQNIKMLKLLVK
jgi:glycosyltransferase involved in cell wall biosynthesis